MNFNDGSLLYFPPKNLGRDKFAQWLLEEFSWNNKTIMVAPAQGFYSTPELGKQQIRFAYVINTSDLEDAVIILEEALKVYPGRINNPKLVKQKSH